MIQSSSSGRVKLNRTILTKDSNALPKKRRSFGGTNLARAVTEPTPENLTLNAGVRKTAPESIEEKTKELELSSVNVPYDGDKNLELSSINTPDDSENHMSPACSELNPKNASPPKSTEVELHQAPEEDKDSSNQGEGLGKGTEQTLDNATNLPYELRRRGADPGQNISAFGDMYERIGGPNTRSKTSGKTSFKACQLEKMKNERVKRHGKQVCCRLAFALCIFGEDSDKIRGSKKEHSVQNRSKCKAENVFVGSGNNRDGRKEKRREGKASLRKDQNIQTIRVKGVKAKKRQSKRLAIQRKRHKNVFSNATACMNTTTRNLTVGLVANGSSQALAVTKRRETATAKKENDRRSLAVCQHVKEGWYSGKIAQVRSSRHVVGTAKKDAKSSHCMAPRRRKSGRVTEKWICKVPGKKPSKTF